MTELFLKAADLSFEATLAIGAIILLRLLFKKVPKWISCLLWSIPAIRLVFPFSLNSFLGIIPQSDNLIAEIGTQSAEIITKNHTDFAANSGTSDYTASVVSENNSYITIFAIIWLIGILSLLIYLLVSTLLLKIKLKNSTLLRNNIYECDSITTAFVFGIINPKIYIPYNTDTKTFDFIISHEISHIKRCDHITKLIAFIVVSVYWFNPFIWLAFILFSHDTELACDEKVIKNFNSDERKSYSIALLSEKQNRVKFIQTPIAFSSNNIKSRVKNIIKFKKTNTIISVSAIILAIIFAICLLTHPQDKNNIINNITVLNYGSDYDGVKISLKDAGFENGNHYLEIKIKNKTSKTLSYSPAYKILKLERSKWTEIAENDGIMWNAIAYCILPGGSDTRTYYPDSIYKMTYTGTYRFETEFFFEDDVPLKPTDEKKKIWIEFEITEKTFSYKNENEAIPATITLTADNKFQFVFSALSSNVPFGSYKIEDDYLILAGETDTYRFKIKNSELIFDEKNSSPLPKYRISGKSSETYSPVPNGAVFK